MERYFGFDLGDAESAVARLEKDGRDEPAVLPVQDERSFITAYAQLLTGELLIGESACYNTNVTRRSTRFKSRFLTDADSEKDVRRFAAGVLGELLQNGDLVKGEDCCFYIGCPAGWDKAARERYRRIFEDVGYPPVRIISESRAALISACQSKHLQVGYDILSKPVLVVDIGSSTTDFAYIMGGREVELQTAGEVSLGGGIMDEILLEKCVRESPDEKHIRRIFEQSPAWKSYCDFAARKLKERYFSDEAYWQTNECCRTVQLLYDEPVNLTLRIDAETADLLLLRGARQLGGKGFRDVFCESLRSVREKIRGQLPELLFLTGGVSRLRDIREWCADVFPEAVVIAGAEPEFSVARGLAWSGRIDAEMREFRREVADLAASSAVEQIVGRHIQELYHRMVDTLVEPILRDVALPVFERWRSGDIRRLSDIDGVMQGEIETWLRSARAQELLVRPITEWLKPVAFEVEEHTMPICVRHNIPYRALSLTSHLSISDVSISIDAKDVFAIDEMTWLINAIVSIIVGLICGGSGLAIISSGVAGILAGTVISLLLLLLGKNRMQKAFMDSDIPRPLRKMVPVSLFESRIERMSSQVKANFFENLENEKNEEISARMVSQISQQIEQYLTKMAEIVEIPLG